MTVTAQQQVKRNLILGAALVATLGLVAWVESQEDTVDGDIALANQDRASASSEKSTPRTASKKAMEAKVQDERVALEWTVLAGRDSVDVHSEADVDLFKSHSWYVPPPPKPAEPPPPPPKPVAPAAPFTYIGKMEDTPTGTLLMLSAGNKLYTVAIGETLDKVWRLDGEDANNLRFTYLPLNLSQTLSKLAKASANKAEMTKKIEKQGNVQ